MVYELSLLEVDCLPDLTSENELLNFDNQTFPIFQLS